MKKIITCICIFFVFIFFGLSLVYAGKPNLIVLTDLGGDPDDQQSLVRLLVYSNEFNIKGIVVMAFNKYTISSSAQMNLVRSYINGYGQVYGKLSQNGSGYPSSSFLRSILKRGATGIPAGSGSGSNVENNLIGSGKDTAGSNWIINVVDNNYSVNISIWGGAVDLAQALWKVKNTRSSIEVNQFVSKIRIYAINDQDDTGFWIRANFSGLFYVLGKSLYGNDYRYAVWRGMYLGGNEQLTSSSWVNGHVKYNHGALGSLYPTSTWTSPNPYGCLKEGDTPSWFYFLDNGLNRSSSPHYGGWGGRFSSNGSYYQDASDHVDNVSSARATVWRWRQDFQNEFQARMDWCVNSYGSANHNPQANINGDLNRTVNGGDLVILDASSSSDPDGNSLSYYWFHYPEPGSYPGTFTIPNNSSSVAQFYAPNVSSTKTMHIILEVKDNGNPSLKIYKRVILTLQPGTNPPQDETISTPNQPSGSSSGKTGQTLTYSTGGATSNLGHTIDYQFNWGDGNYSGWGSSSQSHSYSNSGSYSIKARARCKTHTNIVSNWSASKIVSITTNSYTLSISISPSTTGAVTKNPNKSAYNYNESVQLIANPSTDYLFDKWGGHLSGTSNPRTITMNSDKNITAYFKLKPEEVSPPNTPYGPSSSKINQSVTFSTGGSTNNLGHSVEYQFNWRNGYYSGWGFSSRSYNFTTVGTYTIRARARCSTHPNIVSNWSSGKSFSTSGYEVTIGISPSGTGTVSKSPQKSQYVFNEIVQLTANPSAMYLFDKWGGDWGGSSNPRSLTMNSDKSITAYFKQIPEEVSTPDKPSGASDGKVDQNLTFTTGGSLSNLGHSVKYQFRWGDGTESTWDDNSSIHGYSNAGTFQIRAQARCKNHTNIVSDLSENRTITITPNFYSVSGKTLYFSNDHPVQDVTVVVSGDKNTSEQTNTNGDYNFKLECDKNFKISPFKTKGTDIGFSDITMYDAVLTARYTMGMEQLDDFQLIAADVDKDGSISLLDAVQIARFAVDLPALSDSSYVSEWFFSPIGYLYQNLNSFYSDQNFRATILGNVHGGWLPPGTLNKNEPRVLLYQYLDKIQFENEKVILPIIIDPEQNINSADIELKYDSNTINFVEVEKTVLSKNFHLFHNNSNGELKVGLFSVNPLNEGGVLVKIIFSIKPSFQNKVFFHLKKFNINNTINMQRQMEIILNNKNPSITNYNLSRSYPNPFNNTTQFNLDLPDSGHILAIVYNIKGQEIIKLLDDNLPAGHSILKWNGIDESGSFVNSGIYLLKLVFSEKNGSKEESIRRIILMK